jgi:hypothetical protein
MTEDKEEKIEERYYDYHNIRCIIKKWMWYDWKYIYNTYIILSKKNNKELFEKYILPVKEFKIIESSPIRYTYKYEELDIPFSWWISFYERVFNQNQECVWIQIWNNYNHIWDWDETFESVKQDLEDVVDFITLPPVEWTKKD